MNNLKAEILKAAPWLHPPLQNWSIVGMNHYHTDTGKFIFIAMTKDNICIVEEGPDTITRWENLITKAKGDND